MAVCQSAYDNITEGEDAFLESMLNLTQTFPSDIDAQTQLESSYMSQVRKILRAALVQESLHPGCLNYLIHAFDIPRVDIVLQVTSFAHKYRQEVARTVSYAQYMSSHIWICKGEWSLAHADNSRSVEKQYVQAINDILGDINASPIEILIDNTTSAPYLARTEALIRFVQRYFLLLISPITWFKCLALIFYRTRARTRRIAFLQYLVLLCVVVLMISSCYLFYAVTADSGEYNLYLSNVASNKTSMIEGRQQFDALIWRSVLKTLFLGVIFGLIQACNFYLAAQWRQRLCDRYHELLFKSPNGCVLYETAQIDEDIPKVITNDIKQFTTNLCTVLFGSIFFAGMISSKLQGYLRGYIQRIQTNAECIVLYGSQRVELQYILRLISNIRNSMFIGSISFALVNFPIQLLSSLNGMCTYIMPTVVFFFIRSTQTPELAQAYLTAIPLYSFLITVLGQLLLIMEPALITVTMGDHLWTLLDRLENLTEEHQKRIEYEQTHNIRQDDSNINFDANRGQCVLISGPSGCGKTSLFRICAGLRPIDAERILLPERRNLLFIPQRPYLPLGNLRFQALFLLEQPHNINDEDIYQLFQVVNLQCLLERYTLETIVDWSKILSVGEQQRLSFVRLFAYVTLSSNHDQLVREILVLFDESTSAVDAKTEHEIYAHLIRLQVWFVTISHRSSLIHLHPKSLHLYTNKTLQQQTTTILSLENNEDVHTNELPETKEYQIKNDSANNRETTSDTTMKSNFKWQHIVDIFKFIHLPFHSIDKNLKLQTIIAWIVTLVILGASTWCTYRFTKQTASLYNVLSDYTTPALFSLTVGGGQIIATLYSRRQMLYLTHFFLDRSENEKENNLVYHSRHMTVIPNFLSHDISEFNNQLFYFIFGHIYYTGVIGQIILAIILAVLLAEQSGGSIGVIVIYAFVFGFFFFTNLLSVIFNKWIRRDETKFADFVSGHKRVDLQAEQIALSGERACRIEEEELHQKLDSSIHSQMHSGFYIRL
ncbi:hypothetical protein I4U23_015047 [Adineta vaga]|nr:hypothetical protein I4U23_015047 [Adineta vaga]